MAEALNTEIVDVKLNRGAPSKGSKKIQLGGDAIIDAVERPASSIHSLLQ